MSRVHPLHPSQDRTHLHNNHASTHTSQPQRDIKRPQPNNHPSNHHRDIKRVASNGHNAPPSHRPDTKRAPPAQYSGSRQTIAPRGSGAPHQSHQQQRRAQISAFEMRERQRRAAFVDKDYPSNVKAVILSCMVTWLFCVVLGIISFCYAMRSGSSDTAEEARSRIVVSYKISAAGFITGLFLFVVILAIAISLRG